MVDMIIGSALMKTPMVDKNGVISRHWYLFMLELWNRTGGNSGDTDLVMEENAPFGQAQMEAQLIDVVRGIGSMPYQVDLTRSIDELRTEELRGRVEELERQVQALKQAILS